jgi:RES domain-containing protein
MLYTSESRALAMAEVAVHLPFAIIPKHFVVVVIEIPDEITAQEINVINLDKNWDVLPFEKNTRKIGDQFLAEKKHLTLKVPSVVVKGDFNYLINPSHKHYNKVKVIAT